MEKATRVVPEAPVLTSQDRRARGLADGGSGEDLALSLAGVAPVSHLTALSCLGLLSPMMGSTTGPTS